jgi:hypothetical protein
VRVNGFAVGTGFRTVAAVARPAPLKIVEARNFEIYDALKGQSDRALPKSRDSRAHPGAFSIRVNGRHTGQSFATLDEAVEFLSARRPGGDCAVFEHETCVWVESFQRGLNLVEAL